MNNTNSKTMTWTLLFLILVIMIIILAAEYLIFNSRSGKVNVNKIEKVN